MSSMPEGWSVDIDGAQIIVCVSGRPDDRFRMTIQEARTLRNHLHVAYLVAWSDVDSDPDGAPDSELGATAVSAEMLPASNEADELPIDWRIADDGQSVEVVVPASAADGEFTLSAQEAFGIGRALIRHAGRAQLARWEAKLRAIDETSGTFDAAFGPDYLSEEREGWDE